VDIAGTAHLQPASFPRVDDFEKTLARMLKGQSLLETDPFQRLARNIQDGNCVLFLGAGVSLDSGAPSGREMAEELSRRFFPSESVSTDFGAVREAVNANFSRKTLNEFLIEALKTSPRPRSYRLGRQIPEPIDLVLSPNLLLPS
jgi:hypothetical protein